MSLPRLSALNTIFGIVFALLVAAANVHAQSAINNIDGQWYSPEWRYGYVLRNGVGTATSTNSPNFQVGQNIIQLTATSATTFTGRQVYTDGRFYNVNVTLLPDGRLYFNGEKNVQWTMQRVGSTQNNNVQPGLSTQQEAERQRRVRAEQERQAEIERQRQAEAAERSRLNSICLIYGIARQTCATSGNYDQCMTIRIGRTYSRSDDRTCFNR
jgi:hypothetical protein